MSSSSDRPRLTCCPCPHTGTGVTAPALVVGLYSWWAQPVAPEDGSASPTRCTSTSRSPWVRPAAGSARGRNYHTEALLLPDGRVAVFGSDPLFADKADSRPGRFEQRVEVYSPPYLHRGDRPSLQHGGKTEAQRGEQVKLRSTDVVDVARVRFMRPGSATHVTDFDQRSIALDITRRTHGSLTVRVPDDPPLVPAGWYMVVATDEQGTSSRVVWLHVRPDA